MEQSKLSSQFARCACKAFEVEPRLPRSKGASSGGKNVAKQSIIDMSPTRLDSSWISGAVRFSIPTSAELLRPFLEL